MKGNIVSRIEMIRFYALCSIGVLFPIHYKLMSFAGILYVLLWLAEGNFKQRVKRVSKQNIIGVLGVSIIFATYLFGFALNENTGHGLFSLEKKLLMFLLPPLVITEDFILKKYFTGKLINSFLIGVGIIISINLLLSFISYLDTCNINEFFYTKLTHWNHPSYHGMMVALSILLILSKIIRKEVISRKRIIQLSLIITLLTTYLIMNASRGALLAFFAALIVYFVLHIYQSKQYLKGIITLIVFILFSGFIVSSLDISKGRLLQTKRDVASINSEYYENPNKTGNRVEVWRSAWEIIKLNPAFGVGTGDGLDELKSKYKEQGLDHRVKKNSDSHNQYIHTTLELGILGLAVLLAIMIFNTIKALRRMDILFLSFLTIFAVSMLFESMFERAAGISFFVWFMILFNLPGWQEDSSSQALKS